MVERIKQIIEHYNLSPASFAEVIGINRSNLTHLFSGRNQPSLELAKKILHCYPAIKTEWLIMGVGDMFRNNEDKEFVMKIQNEKQTYSELPKPDLFSNSNSSKKETSLESSIASQNKNDEQIFDSREVENNLPSSVKETEKPIEKSPVQTPPPPSTDILVSKIVFFYSDKSFEVFEPK